MKTIGWFNAYHLVKVLLILVMGGVKIFCPGLILKDKILRYNCYNHSFHVIFAILKLRYYGTSKLHLV